MESPKDSFFTLNILIFLVEYVDIEIVVQHLPPRLSHNAHLAKPIYKPCKQNQQRKGCYKGLLIWL